MKKFLLGLLVALAAFAFGVLAANVFLVELKTISVPAVEEVCVFELVNEDFPPFKVGQLNGTEEMEETEEVKFVEPKIIHAWYSPEDSQKMPELGMIYFHGTDVDDNGNKLNEMIYETGIYTFFYKDDVSEGFAKGIETKVEGNKLKFKTKKLKGIEYRFQGIFFKTK